MSKMWKRVIAVVLVLVVMCTVTACTTTLKGTYVKLNSIEQITFKEDNKVEVSALGLIGVEGEYLIEGGKITITYRLGPISYDMVKSFKKDGNSIYIDGVEFIKE